MPGSTTLAPVVSAAELLGVPLWGWQVALAVLGVAVLILLARTIWHPTVSSLRWWALGNIAVNGGIVVTGATVRVTQSGLGCSEWPRCTPDSFVPSGGSHHPVLNEAIEFGNRTLTSVVLVVGIIVLVAVWRMYGRRGRPDLLALAAAITLLVIVQAALGGITVLTKLDPVAVGPHFLLSMLILVAAVAFYVRCREPRGPLRPTVSPALRQLAAGLVVVGFALLMAGAVTTGTGPLGGDLDAPRWNLDLPTVTRVHSALGWLTAAGAVALLVGAVRTGAPRIVRRQAALLVAVVAAQGAVGYTQYALALPEGLVVLHVLGAVLTWVAILRVYFGTAERTPVTSAVRPAADCPAEAGLGLPRDAPAPGR